jgi:sec-independent protein translocase protein TatC
MLILFEHLIELQWRFIYLILGNILYFCVFYLYSIELSYLLIKPLLSLLISENFIYTNLIDVFLIELKLAFWFSIFLNFWLFCYHTILFIKPGIYKFEFIRLIKIFLLFLFFVIFSLILFYNIFIPLFWSFFLAKESFFGNIIQLNFEIRLTEYFKLIFVFILYFFLFIQIPFFILLFIYFFYFNYQIYRQYRYLLYIYIYIYIYYY